MQKLYSGMERKNSITVLKNKKKPRSVCNVRGNFFEAVKPYFRLWYTFCTSSSCSKRSTSLSTSLASSSPSSTVV